MFNLAKIAARNLRRYKRRSLLTVSLIAFGVVFVLVFVAVTASIKDFMIAQITDSYLGDLQIHRGGYVASIESLPLNLNLDTCGGLAIEKTLAGIKDIEAYSERIKFGALFSNFTETTNIRINGVYPEKEFAALPQMLSRISEGEKSVRRVGEGKNAGAETLGPRVWRQSRRHCRGSRHQQGWIGQRQDLSRKRNSGKRHRSGRTRRLHQYSRMPEKSCGYPAKK